MLKFLSDFILTDLFDRYILNTFCFVLKNSLILYKIMQIIVFSEGVLNKKENLINIVIRNQSNGFIHIHYRTEPQLN